MKNLPNVYLTLMLIQWTYYGMSAPFEDINTNNGFISEFRHSDTRNKESFANKTNNENQQRRRGIVVLEKDILGLLAKLAIISTENSRMPRHHANEIDGNNNNSVLLLLSPKRKLSLSELKDLKEDLVLALGDVVEIIIRKKQPRGVIDDFMKIVVRGGGGGGGGENRTTTSNLTEAASNAATVMKGALVAVNVLDRLGVIDRITDFIQYEIDFFANDF